MRQQGDHVLSSNSAQFLACAMDEQYEAAKILCEHSMFHASLLHRFGHISVCSCMGV